MRRTLTILVAIIVLTIVASPVFALGTIRIEPHAFDLPDPMVVSSPATFNVTVAQHTAYDPQIFLVMTKACYEGLTGNVAVTWTGGNLNFAPADFTAASTGKAPPSTPDADYTIASLQDHLEVPHSENIYYAVAPFLSAPITETNQTFTVTLPSTSPKMLVYAIGKSEATGDYDNRVPNTRPGLVVPEPSIILAALAAFGALGLYSIKKKKPSA